ncbi:hypothetical protein B0H13DRAFT_1878948 [Mycena leptocephala]|nr:hypothetical protein B0H13DRAFT_1878948 [Mycena leptocephala]
MSEQRGYRRYTCGTVRVVILTEIHKIPTEHKPIPGGRSHKTLTDWDWLALEQAGPLDTTLWDLTTNWVAGVRKEFSLTRLLPRLGKSSRDLVKRLFSKFDSTRLDLAHLKSLEVAQVDSGRQMDKAGERPTSNRPSERLSAVLLDLARIWRASVDVRYAAGSGW